jgi:prepilin-type N-terminal cleavage/methylation domain-containing protein
LDLARAGFNSTELRNAGFTLSEIVVAISALANGG